MLNYNLNIIEPLQQAKKNAPDVRPDVRWDYSYRTNINRTFPFNPPYPVSASNFSYATMSISAIDSNCFNVVTASGNIFPTDGDSPVTASLTGSNWPVSGSVTMSFSIIGNTFDPALQNVYFSSSFSASSDVYNLNPSITGSILTSSFTALEYYRYYISGALTHNYPTPIPTGGLIQWLDASNPASYPGSGSVWYDLSGYGHNASSSFGGTFPTFRGNYFDFNGTSDVVSVYTTSSLTAYSMVVWARIGTLSAPTSSRAGGAYSIANVSSSFLPKDDLIFDSLTYNESLESRWEIATEENRRDVTSSLQETSTTDYLMIAMTNAGATGSQNLYRNGQLVGFRDSGSAYVTGDKLLLVGSRYYQKEGENIGYAPEGFYTGSIVGTLFYNRVLTPYEISYIYNAGF